MKTQQPQDANEVWALQQAIIDEKNARIEALETRNTELAHKLRNVLQAYECLDHMRIQQAEENTMLMTQLAAAQRGQITQPAPREVQ